MNKPRFEYIVAVDKDDVPGWNHQPEDMKQHLEQNLPSCYNPNVAHLDVKEIKNHPVVKTLAQDAYEFGCRNPRDVNHPDTPAVFDLWYENIYRNA